MALKGAIKAHKRMDDLEKAIKQAAEDIRKPEAMRGIGAFAAAMVKLRTRLGSGVGKEGDEKAKLKPLAPATKESRERDKAKGILSSNTSPGRSNLTRTGQLLDSLGVKKVSGSNVTIGPKGKRNDGLTNEEVAGYVSEGGREFNFLSKTEIKRTHDHIAKELRKAIKARLTKLKT